MYIVYLSGPISNGDKIKINGQKKNVEKARKIAKRIWEMEGVYVICPHINTPIHVGLTYSILIEQDLKFLKSVDALLMFDGWENSNGALKEYEEAKSLGIRIFYDEDALKRFLKRKNIQCSMCDKARLGLKLIHNKKLCKNCYVKVEDIIKEEQLYDLRTFVKIPRE